MRAELDAAFLNLYGYESSDVDHVLDQFPVLRDSEEGTYGEYRTKRLILEKWEALAQASVDAG